jgi:hypothetical protein
MGIMHDEQIVLKVKNCSAMVGWVFLPSLRQTVRHVVDLLKQALQGRSASRNKL